MHICCAHTHTYRYTVMHLHAYMNAIWSLHSYTYLQLLVGDCWDETGLVISVSLLRLHTQKTHSWTLSLKFWILEQFWGRAMPPNPHPPLPSDLRLWSSLWGCSRWPRCPGVGSAGGNAAGAGLRRTERGARGARAGSSWCARGFWASDLGCSSSSV